jgi:outer membrane cobalamin receptor
MTQRGRTLGVLGALYVLGTIPTRLVAQHTDARIASVTVDASHAKAILARRVTISVTDATVRGAIDAVAKAGNVGVQYRAKDVDAVSRRVSVRARSLPLGVVFERLLDGTGLVVRSLPGNHIAIVVANPDERDVADGVITGVVTDAKTGRPLRGVTVLLDDANRGVRTGDDGVFRLAAVASGSHRVTARLLGYARESKVVTVAGEVNRIDLALSVSANRLDQVVVTGTVIPTEQRAIPNAITVITAKQIEERGITRIDQLFHGDVPGLFAQITGSMDETGVGAVKMFSRGGASFGSVSFPGHNSNGTNPIKTYVDGVELADPQYLTQIDPKSIERIEILTGPQASTIYGSNALSGVMQVFTKRGASNRPQITATLLSGTLENDFNDTFAPQHDYAAQLSGTERNMSYNAGGSWRYTGSWTPTVRQSVESAFGGVRQQWGTFTADASVRVATTRNHSSGGDPRQVQTQRLQNGEIGLPFAGPVGRVGAPTVSLLEGQTLGATFSYTPFPWMSHELALGRDRSTYDQKSTVAAYSGGSGIDTLLGVYGTDNQRNSIRYAMTTQLPVTAWGRLVMTAGGDGWRQVVSTMNANGTRLTGQLSGVAVNRQPDHNAGGFVQGQVGIADALFLTYGIRAEWNPSYGKDVTPNYTPRYGVTYTRDLSTPWGAVTTKLRGSYGRATRPPTIGLATEWITPPDYYAVPDYGIYAAFLGNPHLGPETQRGGEGGVELYFGSRSSLIVTRYDQTVHDIIMILDGADSVRSLAVNPPFYNSLDVDGYGYLWQNMAINGGDIRNQGWEAQGTLTTGPFTHRGTYSWTKSRVASVNALAVENMRKSGIDVTPLAKGSTYAYFPEHTWMFGTTYARRGTLVSLTVNGSGERAQRFSELHYRMLVHRLNVDRLRMNNPFVPPFPRQSRMTVGGYALADLNVTRKLSSRIDGIVQFQNLTDTYQNDLDVLGASLGRQTKAGVRVRW